MLGPRARCVLDTLLPSGAHPVLPRGLFDAGFDAFYAEFERDAAIGLRWGFKAALLVAAWLAPVLIGRLPPIDRLPRAERERALEALGRSRSYLLRQSLLLLKMTASLGYGADAEVRAAVGFPAGKP